ncbi:MAG: YitT family protein [Clostridiales bacterium]|nr:YitT family protein [Clostridiales bacterium]
MMIKKQFRSVLKPSLLVIIGSALYALGYNMFVYPNALVTGGITGISTVINYVTDIIPVGVLIIIFNIPIFIIGGKILGWRFLISSAAGMILVSAFIDIFSIFSPVMTKEPLLAGVFGGVLTGLGLGIVFSAGASTGGTDILAKIVRKNFMFLNMGHIVLAMDVVIIGIYSIIFGKYDLALYSVMMIYVETRIIDVVLYGLNYGKVVFIISEKAEEISREICGKLQRGVTKLYGRGGWSNEDKTVLLVAIKKRQIVDLKRTVKEIDPRAFVIMSETREVLGMGFQDFEE